MAKDGPETADPAVEGGNIGVTNPDEPKLKEETHAIPEGQHVVMDTKSYMGSEGLNIAQKLVFFSVIIGVVAVFLRSRMRAAPVQRYPV